MGCHSVIDRPECVRRVTPPTTINANTSAQQTRSQIATARGLPPVAAEAGMSEGAAKPPGVQEVIGLSYYRRRAKYGAAIVFNERGPPMSSSGDAHDATCARQAS